MVELKTGGEIEALRRAGGLVARVLDAVREHVAVGVRLGELDELAGGVLADAGAQAVLEGHRHGRSDRPFPAVIRTSLNDEIVHGVAGARVLSDGDLLGLDLAARLDGWIGHSALTCAVGACAAEDARLLETTEQALADGIAAARPGARLGDVSRAIGVVGRSAGFGIPPLGGHGLGRGLREEPTVANDGHRGRGMPLRPGLVVSVEPMFTSGGRDHLELRGHAVVTGDDSRAAHFGHTVAITDDGPLVLTARPGG
ncbi:type I methionyl aminopeptidase [Saccharopolyspora halophila]|uniref:type I methionyl aminopeptidase n=1 Tax=Saccharopolyspora halophila TaxID=405551 RepID=UPI0031D80598